MLNPNGKVSKKQTVKLTILLQVRYHREKDKHRAGAHEPGSQRGRTCSGSGNGNSSDKVRGERGGYKQVRGGRACAGGCMNEHRGTNERREVRTWQGR